MRSLLLALSLLAAGCATAPAPVAGPRVVSLPSGAQGLEVRCNGTHRTTADCMNAAALACHGAYQILSEDQGSTASAAVPIGGAVAVVHVMRRSLIVACGA